MYRVQTIATDGTTSEPTYISAMVRSLPQLPTIPTVKTVRAINSETIYVEWNSPGIDTISEYVVYRSTSADGSIWEVGCVSAESA